MELAHVNANCYATPPRKRARAMDWFFYNMGCATSKPDLEDCYEEGARRERGEYAPRSA